MVNLTIFYQHFLFFFIKLKLLKEFGLRLLHFWRLADLKPLNFDLSIDLNALTFYRPFGLPINLLFFRNIFPFDDYGVDVLQ
jgi:hypothetical protein